MSKTQAEKERDQGLSILDIGKLGETVPLGNGESMRVYGVSVKGLFSIFQRFPEVGAWFKGGTTKIDPNKLILEAPDAIGAIIAAGCGKPGNELAEENAGMLAVEMQLDILEAIARLTFKSGFGPFVLRIVALSEQVKSLNSGKALGTISRPVSKNVSTPDTAASPSGA